jgi:glycosyltransferase involved in cell wall biosynthesis
VHHGFISELSDNLLQIQSVNEIIRLCQAGKIDKLGVVKTGHEQLFAELFGIKTVLLYNKIPVAKNLHPKHAKNEKLNIGVLMNNSFRKNFHTQVVAALLIEHSTVHVIDKSELYYLNSNTRIKEHGILQHAKFLDLLSSMDINLHVTFSESFGGQVFTESLGAGVPCLSGYSNGFLNNNESLRDLLCVKEMDDPLAISRKVVELLELSDTLREKLITYCAEMNNIADKSLQCFLREDG